MYYFIMDISLFVESFVILHISSLTWKSNQFNSALNKCFEQKPVVLMHGVGQNEIQVKMKLTWFDLTVT